MTFLHTEVLAQLNSWNHLKSKIQYSLIWHDSDMFCNKRSDTSSLYMYY